MGELLLSSICSLGAHNPHISLPLHWYFARRQLGTPQAVAGSDDPTFRHLLELIIYTVPAVEGYWVGWDLDWWGNSCVDDMFGYFRVSQLQIEETHVPLGLGKA